MKIDFLGHAGFQVVCGDIRLLLDPWGPDYRPFLGTWRQWPSNRGVFTNLTDLRSPTHVWCSHMHGDHFDPVFLSSVDKDACVILPSFPGTSMRAGFEDLGFKSFIELGHMEAADLDEQTRVVMLLEKPERTEHASLFVQSKDGSFFHNGDTSLDEETFETFRANIAKRIDVFFGQHSDPSSFPHVMNWDADKKARVTVERGEAARLRFCVHVEGLNAQYAIPGAGPVLIRPPGGPLQGLGEQFAAGGPYDFQGVKDALNDAVPDTRVEMLLPGDGLDLTEGVASFHASPMPDERACRIWMDDIGMETEPGSFVPSRDLPTIDSRAPFAALHLGRFVEAANLCPETFRKFDFRFNVRFPDLDCCFALDFRAPPPKWTVEIHPSDEIPSGDHEHFSLLLDSAIWDGFLKNTYCFDEINFSRSFTVDQSERGFSIDFLQLLKSMHDPDLLRGLDAESRLAPNQEHTVLHKGKPCRILSHCPHQGLSLVGLEPDEQGIITCPGHGWKFSVLDGACVLGDTRKSIKAPSGHE